MIDGIMIRCIGVYIVSGKVPKHQSSQVWRRAPIQRRHPTLHVRQMELTSLVSSLTMYCHALQIDSDSGACCVTHQRSEQVCETRDIILIINRSSIYDTGSHNYSRSLVHLHVLHVSFIHEMHGYICNLRLSATVFAVSGENLGIYRRIKRKIQTEVNDE